MLSSVGGTSKPSALAVLRLMTRSNLVDRMTRKVGRLFSPGVGLLRLLDRPTLCSALHL
jgi:hypothetical protein